MIPFVRSLFLSSILLAGAAPTAHAQDPIHGEASAVPEANSEGTLLTPTNTICPVLTDEEVDPEIFTEYEGRRVYLCCRKCLKQFRADPSAYLANLPANFFSETREEEHGEHDHAEPGEEGTAHGIEEAEEHGHTHGDGDGDGEHVGLIERLGRYHPLVVHFPIGLLVAAAFAELLAIFGRGQRFFFAARFCLWIGAPAAVLAALLGWADAIEMAEDYSGFSATLLLYHRWLGIVTAGVSLLALWMAERVFRSGGSSGKGLYRGLLFLGVVLVSIVGHLGASLIYGWEFLSW